MWKVCRIRVKFNVDLCFNEVRRLYLIKFKKSYPHRKRNNKEELERESTKGIFKIS